MRTILVVGGGFSGVEGFGELLSLATALVRKYPELSPGELSFHLVEARDRILPEVTGKPGEWVVHALERRGARVHLDAQLVDATDGHVRLSTGEEFDSELIVWTVGNAANPMVHNHTDLPIDARGMLVVRADLRAGTDEAPVEDAWGAGDDAAVPDLAASWTGRAHLGAEGPGPVRLGDGRTVRPGHRVAGLGAAPAERVCDRRRARLRLPEFTGGELPSDLPEITGGELVDARADAARP